MVNKDQENLIYFHIQQMVVTPILDLDDFIAMIKVLLITESANNP